MSTLSKRITIRFAAEDDHWLAEQADDEGVDKATMLRMLVSRLRQGRPPLVRMMLETVTKPKPPFYRVPAISYVQDAHGNLAAQDHPEAPEPLAPEEVDELLAGRMAEMGIDPNAPEPIPHPPQQVPPSNGTAAVSLRRIPRQVYNPGRSGTG